MMIYDSIEVILVHLTNKKEFPEPLLILTEFCAKGSMADRLKNKAIEISDQIKFKWIEGIAIGLNYFN